MLSYRHAFHAGNFADVLKHLVLVHCLNHLGKKDKDYRYIDTHAGAGGYSLKSADAQKNAEFETGISKLMEKDDLPEPIQAYVNLVKSFSNSDKVKYYPGSPSLAAKLLRDNDQLYLHELHPADLKSLRYNFRSDRRTKLFDTDGYEGLIAAVPPPQRRGMVLIDPPYEIKTDYQKTVKSVIKAHKRFATGTYAIWYPVVERYRIREMEDQLVASGIRNIQLFELAMEPDSDQFGMTATGMILINPPWTLKAEMDACLPYLVKTLSINSRGQFRSVQLVEE